MLRTILISLIVILSGCVSTQNEKLTSKRVGVLTPESHNNQFCYLYRGVTVFNNESARVELSPNFSNSFNTSVGKGITKSGNIPVSLGKLPAHKSQVILNVKSGIIQLLLLRMVASILRACLNQTKLIIFSYLGYMI